MIARYFLLAVLLPLSLMSACAGSADDWQGVAPAEAGFAPDLGERLDAGVRAGAFVNLHGVVIARDGKLVLERYYEGPDQSRGRGPLGTVAFGPKVKHDLRSVSKSIVGLLYGIALAEGEVPGPERSLIELFPAYEDLAAEPERRRMTVAHALSMTLGTAWDESLPYTDPRNSETAMDRAADRPRFVLEQPIVVEPGSRWAYNGGATALLAHLIARGSGRPLLDYAREKLFQPLGIHDVNWAAYPDGEAIAASGLRLRPRDLAKIGQLVLDRGAWGEAQVVPAAWLDQSFTPRARVGEGLEYGYQWWLGRSKASGQAWIGARGNGGQRLFVVPDLRLVVVITAGNYNKPDQRELPTAVMRDVVIPALRAE